MKLRQRMIVMKINISRHQIYILLLSLFLFLFVLAFSFGLLIPEGKEYRVKRMEMKKAEQEHDKYQNFNDKREARLKDLQNKNRNIIVAYDREFNAERFKKEHKKDFTSLSLSKLSRVKDKKEFAVYEVNTTSHISSPKNFYNFLESLNKGDWIIGVNFPIKFVRDGEMINSSFTMKVYSNNKDNNSTASKSSAK